MTKTFKTLALSTAIGLTLFGPVQAESLKIATGDGPQHETTKALATWAEHLEKISDGKLTGRVFAQTLVSAKEVPAALRDGVADVGFIIHPYHPAEFPEANLIADFSLFANDSIAAAGAATEYMHQCKECMEEMRDAGMIYLGNIANAPYSLLTKNPVTTLEDFKNLRVRSGGEAWGRWIEGMGR